MSAISKCWIGLAAWSVFVVARVPSLGHEAWSQAHLLFVALVLAPLAMGLFREEGETGGAPALLRRAGALQLPAALLLGVACWIPAGLLAGLASLPWLVFTGLLASAGVARLMRDGVRRSLDGLCADAALLFAAGGGAWTLAERGGYSPFGFDGPGLARMTFHFHYLGLLLPLFAGLVQRELWFWRFASRAAVGVVLGVPAAAAGMVATQLRWGESLEMAGGAGLALAGMAVAVLQVRIALESKRHAVTRGLLAVAGASLFFTMVLTGLQALRGAVAAAAWLGPEQMRMLHGTVSAVGYGLCGVLAWWRLTAEKDGRDGAVKKVG